MKKWVGVADVIGQPLDAFGENVSRGKEIILVFRDSFVVIAAEYAAYGEIGDPPDAIEVDSDPDVLDRVGAQMLIDLGIATPQEVASLIAARDAEQAKCEADRIQAGIAAEREQYERLRKKFADS